MAGHASGGELRCNVIRHLAAKGLRAQPGRLMASITISIRGCESKVVVDVARTARRGYVRALQRPARRAVIEFAVRPQQGVMASRALGRREACRDVIRYCATECLRAQPGRLVATIAICVRYRKGVVVSDVAIGALHDFPGRLQLVRTR